MKKLLSFGLSALLVLSLAACGSGGTGAPSTEAPASSGGSAAPSSDAASGEPVTIEFWYAFGDKVGENNEALVKRFNESQDKVVVKAEYQGGSYNDLHTKVQAAFAAKSAPAVFLNEITVMKNFADAGMTQPLQPYLDRDGLDAADFIPGLLSNTYVDGTLYGLPYLRSTPLLYYNVSMFEKAGIGREAPKTFEETLEFSRKLVQSGASSGLATPVTTWTYEALVDSSGGRFLNEDETKAVFNTPEAMKAMDFYLKGVNEGIFKITTGGDATSQAKMEFQNQHAGMIFGSTADLTYYMQVAQETGFELGAAFIPDNGEGSVPTGGCNMVMSAGLTEEQADAAWEFIKFATGKEQTIETSIATGYLPNRVSATEDAKMQQLYSEKPLFKVAVDQLETAIPRPMAKNFPEVNSMLLDALMECVINPQDDPQPVLDKAAAEADAILAS